MSDVAQGPGWWQASDGRWYPPEALAQALGQAPPGESSAPLPGSVPPSTDAAGVPAQVAMEGYGHVPAPGMAAYPWPAAPTSPARQRSRAIGALLVLLGLAGVVWGIGELFNALALNASPVYPHDEQVGAWIVTAGILLASVVTVAIGLVCTSD